MKKSVAALEYTVQEVCAKFSSQNVTIFKRGRMLQYDIAYSISVPQNEHCLFTL